MMTPKQKREIAALEAAPGRELRAVVRLDGDPRAEARARALRRKINRLMLKAEGGSCVSKTDGEEERKGLFRALYQVLADPPIPTALIN
jgi:hypothetical protein